MKKIIYIASVAMIIVGGILIRFSYTTFGTTLAVLLMVLGLLGLFINSKKKYQTNPKSDNNKSNN